MQILDVFPATVEFEGETYEKCRAIVEDSEGNRRELTVMNDQEELEALGSMDAVKAKLMYHEGKFGPFLRLPNYERTGNLNFG